MEFTRNKVATALACLAGIGSAVTLSGAYAQTTAPDIRVEVTGSNIKRIEGEGALPVQAITHEDIERSGVQTAMELIDRISASQSLGNFNAAIGEGSLLVGFNGASLRGLGTARTLVLINGKRVAPYALSTGNNYSGVDLSQIPLAAIERVEILKDGASAIYGTDAIAGVINVILRKDFQGVQVGGTYLDSDKGGGGNQSIHGTFGWGDLSKDRLNAFLTFDYQKQLSLRALDREISKTAYLPALGKDQTSANVIPANISQDGFPTTLNPTFPTCLPPFSITAGRTTTCRFDFAATIDTIPPSEKTNVLGRVTWQLHSDHQAFFEGSYNRGIFTQVVSPTPVSSAFTTNPVQLFPNSPFYPTAFVIANGGDPTLPLGLSWRSLELGGRTDRVTVDQYRAVAGMQGVVRGWDYTWDVNYTTNKQVDTYTKGYLSEARLLPILASGVLNPFGLNSPEALAIANTAQILGDASSNKASNYGVDAKISNTIYNLPAGPVALALGGEWRKEKLDLINSAFLSSGDIIGGGGAIPSLQNANRSVYAVFGEVNIPIVKDLEGNVAVRYDHYSDFGSTTNPKFSLRWLPARDLLVRASYGTGFRAPTLFDLDQPIYRTNTNNNFSDPVRCGLTGEGNVFDCDLQFNSLRGGNAALKPERSTQYNAGVVWEPNYEMTRGLSIGVDYYWIEIKDVITQITADSIFANFPVFASTVVPAAGYNGATYIIRQAPDPQFPNLPGSIFRVVEPTVNLGKQLIEGFDIDLRYRVPISIIPANWGTWTGHLTGSYITKFKQTQAADNSFINVVGSAGTLAQSTQGAIARWRHYATIDWSYGPWGVTLAQTFQNGYNEPDLLADDPKALRRVGAYDIYDIQGRYNGFKNVALAVGVRNMFNRAPPVSGSPGTFQVGYDASYADPRGRMLYGSVEVTFK